MHERGFQVGERVLRSFDVPSPLQSLQGLQHRADVTAKKNPFSTPKAVLSRPVATLD